MLRAQQTIDLSPNTDSPRPIDAIAFRDTETLVVLRRNDPLLYELNLEVDSVRTVLEFLGDVSERSTRWRFSGDRASAIASSTEGATVFRLDNGAERWSRRERVWPAPIAYTEVNATVLAAVSQPAGEAFTLDLHTGAELWRSEFTDKITPPRTVGAFAAGPDLLLFQRGFVLRCAEGRAPSGEPRYIGHAAQCTLATVDPPRLFLVADVPYRDGMQGGDLLLVHGDGKALAWRPMSLVVPVLELPNRSVLVVARSHYSIAPDTLQVRSLDDGAEHSAQPWTSAVVTAAALSDDRTRVALGTNEGKVVLFALDS